MDIAEKKIKRIFYGLLFVLLAAAAGVLFHIIFSVPYEKLEEYGAKKLSNTDNGKMTFLEEVSDKGITVHMFKDEHNRLALISYEKIFLNRYRKLELGGATDEDSFAFYSDSKRSFCVFHGYKPKSGKIGILVTKNQVEVEEIVYNLENDGETMLILFVVPRENGKDAVSMTPVYY